MTLGTLFLEKGFFWGDVPRASFLRFPLKPNNPGCCADPYASANPYQEPHLCKRPRHSQAYLWIHRKSLENNRIRWNFFVLHPLPWACWRHARCGACPLLQRPRMPAHPDRCIRGTSGAPAPPIPPPVAMSQMHARANFPHPLDSQRPKSTNGIPRRHVLIPLCAAMAGAGGKSMGAYDYLIKLMLIGDSGVSRHAQDQSPCPSMGEKKPCLGAATQGMHTDSGHSMPARTTSSTFCATECPRATPLCLEILVPGTALMRSPT